MKRNWDPRTIGCDCDNCPLQEYPFPVPPESHKIGTNPRLTILGESPGLNEVAEGKPFCGASGWELERALKKSNIRREECDVTNAILCRPKKNMEPKEWKKALKACKPRLDSELTSKQPGAVLAMGGKALLASYGKAKITSWRGSPLEADIGSKCVNILPTIHPAFVLRKPATRPIFQNDVSRGVKLADGKLPPFEWPRFYVGSDKGTILGYLHRIAQAGLPVGIDVETAGVNPLSAGLLALGASNTVEGVSFLWTEDPDLRAAYQRVLSQCECVTQNGSHDVLSLRAHGFEIDNGFDTLLAHAVVAPNLKHDLGFIVSCFFHAERWKTIAKVEKDLKGAEGWRDWRERDPKGFKVYNVKDCAGTVLAKKPLEELLAKRHRGRELYDQYMRLQTICMKIKKRGVLVDPKTRRKHGKKYTEICKETKEEFYDKLSTMGIKGITLGAGGIHWTHRKLFFDHFGYRPRKMTKKNQPSCDKDFLESVTDGEAGDMARTILKYRKHYKLLSTYVRNLPVDSEGIIHADFLCHGAITGRFASRRPNLQNQPYVMRDMYIAFLWQYFLKADYVGLEAALIAFFAGDDVILDEYFDAQDLHMNRAREMFGQKIYDKAMSDIGGKFYKKVRRMAKDTTYAWQYGAMPETIWKRLRNTFPDLTLREVQLFVKRLDEGHKPIKAFHKYLERVAYDKKYVEEPLSGRRQYFNHDRVDMNKVYNFPAQGGAATLINGAIEDLDKRCDWVTSGISAMIHDELNWCGVDPVKGYSDVVESMRHEIEYQGRKMRMRVDVEIGLDLLNTTKVNGPEDIRAYMAANPR